MTKLERVLATLNLQPVDRCAVDYGVRFPSITEDAPKTHYLCHEYGKP